MIEDKPDQEQDTKAQVHDGFDFSTLNQTLSRASWGTVALLVAVFLFAFSIGLLFQVHEANENTIECRERLQQALDTYGVNQAWSYGQLPNQTSKVYQ